MNLPDLSAYALDRVVDNAPVWGVAVPGLRAAYYRRGTGTAGLYAFHGTEIFLAWGRAGERHCRFHAFRTPDGGWEPARRGCPRVRATADGLLLRTRAGERYLTGTVATSV